MKISFVFFSDSGVKDSMRKNIHDKAVLVNGAAILTDNNPSNSFIYYLPETNELDSQPHGVRLQDKRNQERNTIQNGESTAARTSWTATDASPHISKPVLVDLTLDSDEENNDEKDLSTFPKILAAYSLHENSDLCNLINRNAQENELKRNSNTLVLNSDEPNGWDLNVTSAQSTYQREIAVSTSSLNIASMTPSNVTTFGEHHTPLATPWDRIHHTERVLNRTGFPNDPSSQKSRGVLTGHHNVSESRVNFAAHPGTLVNVGTVNLSAHSPLSNLANCTVVSTTTIDGQRTPSSSQKYNNSVVQPLNILRNKPNGIVFDNRVKTHNVSNQNASLPVNGVRYQVGDVNGPGHVRNEVMHDVTNIHGVYGYEYRPVMLSALSAPLTTSNDSDDNVVITKIVTPTDKDKGRTKQRRKTPIAVRQWSPEEAQPITEPTEKCTLKQVNTKRKSLENSLRGVVANKQKINSPNNDNIQREAKIKTLKNLLEKQEKAVEKLRTTDITSPSLPTDRVLVVEIPDLKSELRISNKGEQSFRVCSQAITISPTDSESSRKRRRKRDPRKISRQEDRYPSYVEYKDSDDDDLVAAKRFKGKQKGAKARSRGRNSPKPIAVVEKDAWHRELEKAEIQLTQTDGVVDKNTFMLFLGLKKV